MTTESAGSQFKGAVIHSDFAYPNQPIEHFGAHQVLRPLSHSDVQNAIKQLVASKESGNPVPWFVRGGIQPNRQAVKEAGGGVVIDLTDLDEIRWESEVLVLGAGVTNGDVVNELLKSNKGYVLPLENSAIKSIGSNVLNEKAPLLVKSLGLLADYIVRIRGVSCSGQEVFVGPEDGEGWQQKVLNSKTVVTEVAVRPAAANELWMLRATVPNMGDGSYQELVSGLMHEENLRPRVDVSVRAHEGDYQGESLLSVFAAGALPEDREAMRTLVTESLNGIGISQDEINKSLIEQNGVDVCQAVLEFAQEGILDASVESERLYQQLPQLSASPESIRLHASELDRELFKLNSLGGRDLAFDVRIQALPNNRIQIFGYEYRSQYAQRQTLIHSSSDQAGFADAPSLFEATPVDNPIAGFSGTLLHGSVISTTAPQYYAFHKRPNVQQQPYMVCAPKNESDVIAVVQHAAELSRNLPPEQKKSVVACSGGHQYSGLSSGDENTIVLLMANGEFARQPTINADGHVQAGSGVMLSTLINFINTHGLSLPCGECPTVAIGGHGQTGGFGHIGRAFGLMIDYIHSFRIVLAQPHKFAEDGGHVLTVERPKEAVDWTPADLDTDPAKFKAALFWAVLGGNAGSFGIVLHYTFDCIPQGRYPNVKHAKYLKMYQHGTFEKLMAEMQAWSKAEAAGTLPHGQDFTLTITSKGRTADRKVPLILCGNSISYVDPAVSRHSSQSTDPARISRIFADDLLMTRVLRNLPQQASVDGRLLWDAISLSKDFIHKPHLFDGSRHWREFNFPYQKSLYVSHAALTDGFIDGIVQLVSDVVRGQKYSENIRLVSQHYIGGGEMKNHRSTRLTALPRRDFVFAFSFDLFCEDDSPQTLNDLKEIRSRLVNLLNAHFDGGENNRFLWATFGHEVEAGNQESFNETDMNRPDVVSFFYDKLDDYKTLQKIKLEVDPKNLFNTTLTVKPAPAEGATGSANPG